MYVGKNEIHLNPCSICVVQNGTLIQILDSDIWCI